MISLQQANQFMQGSPFANPDLQEALGKEQPANMQLKNLVMGLYGEGDPASLSHIFKNMDEEMKGYALSIITNFLIYEDNDILFIKTAEELIQQNEIEAHQNSTNK